MKKTFVLSLITLLLINSINAQSKVIRTTSDYSGIKCAGSSDFILIEGLKGEIIIEGNENSLKRVITQVRNGNLIIKASKSGRWGNPIRITLPFQGVERISLAGSGSLKNEGEIKSNSLSISLAGSGDISLNIEASSVKAGIAGSGDMILKGSTNDLNFKMSGSGDFHGFGLQSNNTVVSIAGSGDAEVVSNESLKARIAGSGDIEYKGNPEKKDTKVSGSGSISNY